jgi:hypothetical protein
MRASTLGFGGQYLYDSSHYATYEEGPVYGSVRLVFQTAPMLTIDAQFDSALHQGVGVRLPKRRGRINGHEGERFILWDYAPFPVSVEVLGRKAPFEIAFWNVWRGPHDATMAWVGNAGMRVLEQHANHVALACDAGPNPVTFSDLEILISWPETAEGELTLPQPPSAHWHAGSVSDG